MNLGYEVFIALLSILSIVNSGLSFVPRLTEASREVIYIFQIAIAIIFLGDFLYRLFTAKSKSRYLFREWGWADLAATVPFLRILRVFRLFRVYRLMKELGPERIKNQLLYDRAGSVLYLTIFLGLLIIQMASISVLGAESKNVDANIQTPLRCHLVVLRHHHHRGLWRPLPDDKHGANRRRPADDQRRGPVRRVHQLSGKPLPDAQEEAEREGGDVTRRGFGLPPG